MHVKRRSSIHSGFSLIEAMIAVVVLGVGLLALVAMQSNIVRAGADAKARSRIASLVSSKVDEARASGYYGLVEESTTVACETTGDVCDAQNDAAVSNLTLNRAITRHVGATGTESEYKRLSVTASWTDAGGESRTLTVATDVSPRSLDATSTVLNQVLAGDVAKVPVVRTTNPATEGVVPIALGDGSASAASNPTPELVGKNQNTEVVGTRFNILTYVPSAGDAVIQRRTETAVVKCSCEFGALGADVGAIYKEPQWPAIWTGFRYDLYEPDGGEPAPGTLTLARPVANVNQSPLCLECCRDHHDTAVSGVAKFDPERPADSAGKFNMVNNALGPDPVTSGPYVNACRVIRVDGLWRTASDMYLRQMGLLETRDLALNGLPTDTATAEYEQFVKGFLSTYTGASGTPQADAETLFNTDYTLNLPELVTIAAPSPTDYRYLHARGLYVDYLESAARAKIEKAYDECQGTSKADCILPYLPFTSANLTEIARWAASDGSVLGVNSGNLLATNPDQPSGGRSFGKAAGESTNIVTTGRSNSGIAVTQSLASVIGVDPSDWAIQAEDSQAFRVEGEAGDRTGDEFSVKITGGGSNPYVYYVIGTDTAECVKPKSGDHECVTNSLLPTAGTVHVSHYWQVVKETRNVSCTVGTTTVTEAIEWPKLLNYQVASTNPASASKEQVGSNGGLDEATLIQFSNLPADAVVTINLTEETPHTLATVKSCTLNGGNNRIQSIVWNEEWAYQ